MKGRCCFESRGSVDKGKEQLRLIHGMQQWACLIQLFLYCLLKRYTLPTFWERSFAPVLVNCQAIKCVGTYGLVQPPGNSEPILQACGVILAGILSLVFKFDDFQSPENHIISTPSIMPLLNVNHLRYLSIGFCQNLNYFYIFFISLRQ